MFHFGHIPAKMHLKGKMSLGNGLSWKILLSASHIPNLNAIPLKVIQC